MGSIWEAVGAVWGVFLALLAAFWPFFCSSKLNFLQAWGQDEVQKVFWVNFGWIFEGFGKILGRFWGSFGRFLEWFWFDFGKDLIYEGGLILNLKSSLHAEVWLI